MQDLYQMPGHLIRRAQHVSTAIFADERAAFDLTSVQYAALCAVDANPVSDATRLSLLIAFDRSTSGDVLERLEAKGWISRICSLQDGRVKLVRLSPTGERLLRQVEPAVRRVQKRLLAPLALGDRVTIVKLLMELTKLHNEATSVPLRTAPRT